MLPPLARSHYLCNSYEEELLMSFANTTPSTTLAQRLMPRQGILENKAVFDTVLVVAGCLFMALLAQIRIPLPFTPVPITGQTLGVLLVGGLLGTRLGLFTMLLYLVAGTVGLPFFAGGSAGVQVWQGATIGYLVSYPIVSALMGAFAERGWDRNMGKMLVAMAIGSAVIYLFGAGWMVLGLGRDVGAALMAGVVPFLIGDAIKAVIAAGVLPGGWKLLGSDKQRD
jgi:biotin transport system substrate-specific component